jgi:hypothetical protein
MWHRQGTGEVHTRFWWDNLTEGDHLEDLGIILNWTFKKWYGEAWIGLLRLRIGIDGGCL